MLQNVPFNGGCHAFSTLTLLVGRQEALRTLQPVKTSHTSNPQKFSRIRRAVWKLH